MKLHHVDRVLDDDSVIVTGGDGRSSIVESDVVHFGRIAEGRPIIVGGVTGLIELPRIESAA